MNQGQESFVCFGEIVFFPPLEIEQRKVKGKIHLGVFIPRFMTQ